MMRRVWERKRITAAVPENEEPDASLGNTVVSGIKKRDVRLKTRPQELSSNEF
jgi:hypothetical protein